jgi:hypothetical protein
VEILLREKLVKIRLFDQIFLKAPQLPKSITVYRGLFGEVATKLEKMKKGDVFITKGFNSTALDFNISLQFSNYGTGESIILRILLPKGTPYVLLSGGAYQEYGETTFKKIMQDARSHFDQSELVLNRGSRMVVRGNEKHRVSPRDDYHADRYKATTYIKIIDMHLLPQGELEPLREAAEIIKDVKDLRFYLQAE